MAVRRLPRQRRSQAKVDAILDAANALVAEQGAEALTTTAVAERAGVAVGTLYQYFSNAQAIAAALLEHHGDAFAEQLGAELAERRFARKREAANAALDAFIAYCRREPAFLALWRSSPWTGAAGAEVVGGAERALVELVAAALQRQGLARAGDPAFELEAQVQWSLAVALVHLAFERDHRGDEAVLAHLRRLFDLDVTPSDRA